MILIFTHSSTYRLQYICQFIFKEQLGIAYSITLNEAGFLKEEGAKINYSSSAFTDQKIFNIKPHTLLFENAIKEQQIQCFQNNGNPAFFKIADSEFAFDLFAAAFYLLSRYEEYLPFEKDMYGRFAHENSLAYKENFLHIPVVNIWLQEFKDALKKKFPLLVFTDQKFNFLPTYDIDIAWSYQAKGIIRNIGGFLKSPSFERIKVLLGKTKDPFDSYDFLDELHKKNKLLAIYFFLVAAGKSKYDKNISPDSPQMAELIKRHANQYIVGIHPSWQSNTNAALLKTEKLYLEKVTGNLINQSRQHYIKFTLPETFTNLIAAGIAEDYSMGYGSINGFRASVASSFKWYNLKTDRQTELRLSPFCYMDANCFYEQKLNATEAYKELLHYYSVCREFNGTLITIFHNDFLSGSKKYHEWTKFYQKFISEMREQLP